MDIVLKEKLERYEKALRDVKARLEYLLGDMAHINPLYQIVTEALEPKEER